MQLLIYAATDTPAGQKLVRKITLEAGDSPIDFFDSLDAFGQRLRNPICTSLLAVLLPKDDQELTTLIQMRHLLRNIRIVLILPNREAKAIADSHILRPRYISYSDGDMSDVTAVLHKMTQMERTYYRQAV